SYTRFTLFPYTTLFRSTAYRIIFVSANRRRSQTHINDANVVFVFIERVRRTNDFGRIHRADDPIKSSQQCGARAHSKRIQYPKRSEEHTSELLSQSNLV